MEAEVQLDSFWQNSSDSAVVFQQLNQLKQQKERVNTITRTIADAETGLALLRDNPDDADIMTEVVGLITQLESVVSNVEISCLLSGEWDTLNCIVTINAGAGGTDAQDWAQMLLRMYTRWFAKKHFSVELTDMTPGDEAGIKSATLLVNGEYAYGFCKNDVGNHRLVRQSPFNANAKRQTSFAAVDVIPQFDKSYANIAIAPGDLRIDTFRASGAGGQHINKTDSAVRITHLPTGIVAQSQSQRSQTANKETAMAILTARIVAQLERQQADKINDLKNDSAIAWGSQIRSYVFHPYKLVKDHRTDTETANITAVMDGDIDVFIEAQLRHASRR